MELYSIHRFPWGTSIWGFATAALLVAAAVLGNLHLAILALAPAMLSLGLWFGCSGEFRARLEDDSLVVEDRGLTISYTEIEGLTVGGFGVDPDWPRFRAGAVMVMHRRGILEIPAALNVPIRQVYRALLALVPTTGSCRLSPEMSEHARKEAATFGADKVHTFGRRKIIGHSTSTRRGQSCAAALLLCGILWCVVCACLPGPFEANRRTGWLVAGILLSILSMAAWLLLYLQQRSRTVIHRALANAEMVISPTGIALKQGDVQGHLRWGELLDVRFLNRARFAVSSAAAQTIGSIQLVISGAKIGLADVYDRPIALIHGLIRGYWKGE